MGAFLKRVEWNPAGHRATEVINDERSTLNAAGPASNDTLMPGTRIANHEIIRPLGRGGMGEVYLARDVELDRLVAVKLLMQQSAKHMARFLVEARATARCQHENIVVIHQVGEYFGRPYMVLEYLAGNTLRQWVEQHRAAGIGETTESIPGQAQEPSSGIIDAGAVIGKLGSNKHSARDDSSMHNSGPAAPALTPRQAAKIMLPVARALAYAHRQGIIHRDLKPANIMITDADVIKVLDFGVAKLRACADQAPPAGDAVWPSASLKASAILGTLPYMSPEQLAAEGVDHRSDIWAIGIMLYELCFGTHPLAPLSRPVLMQVGLLDQPMPGASERIPGLGAIIDHCLRKHKHERMGSARELVSALEGFLSTEAEADIPAVSFQASEAMVDSDAIKQDMLAQLDPVAPRIIRPWAIVGTGAALLFAAALGGAVRWSRSAHAPAEPAPSAMTSGPVELAEAPVVLADFVNHTDDPFLGVALATALRIGLEQSREVQVLPITRVHGVLALMEKAPDSPIDRATGIEICHRTGAGALLIPSVAKVGDSFLLGVEIVLPATGAVLTAESAQARHRDELLDTLGSLTRSLRQRLGETMDMLQADSRGLDEVTTSNIEALRAYTLANEKMSRSQFEAAEKLFLLALSHDPGFAMAHAKLGMIYYYGLRNRERGLSHWQSAMQYRARLSEREALYVEGSMAWEGEPAEALRIWRLYASLYPDQAAGFANLGFVYWWYMGRFAEAAEAFATSARLDPTIARTHRDLGYSLLGLGRYEEAIAAFESAHTIGPRSQSMSRADVYLAVRDHSRALAVLDEDFDPGTTSVSYDAFNREMRRMQVFLDQGLMHEASIAVDGALALAHASEQTDERARALFAKASIAHARGDRRSLERTLAEITRILLDDLGSSSLRLMGHPVVELALVGALYARHGRLRQAVRIRSALQHLLDRHDIRSWDAYVAVLDGEIWLARGNADAAISSLRRGLGAVDLFQLHDSLARALRAVGLDDEAARELIWLSQRRGQAIAEWGDSFFGRELNLLAWARSCRMTNHQNCQKNQKTDAEPRPP